MKNFQHAIAFGLRVGTIQPVACPVYLCVGFLGNDTSLRSNTCNILRNIYS